MSTSFPIERHTRSTGMGAYNNSYLYSIRQEKELDPHRTTSSRTGNHGTKVWNLMPGTYIEVWISRSNSGKGDWHIDLLRVDKSGNESKSHLKEPPAWLKPLVEESIWDAVYFTPHE